MKPLTRPGNTLPRRPYAPEPKHTRKVQAAAIIMITIGVLTWMAIAAAGIAFILNLVTP